MSLVMRRLKYSASDFSSSLKKLLDIASVSDETNSVDLAVSEIIADIREKGDEALLAYTRKFDVVDVHSVNELTLSQQRLQQALEKISKNQREALQIAKNRIETYHKYQVLPEWRFEDEFGHSLGQKVKPIKSVGMYVPGGKASYPSTVLMNAVPAKVAGVENLVMVVPTPNGEVNELVLAAAALAGVDQVFTIGGAQAIAALAYGTETVPAVYKIVGPGNQYVASAKKQVFGKVGIDMIAGPSEILIYCDGLTNPDWIAMDLFSQAEHDEMAQSILITHSETFLDEVEQSINRLITSMPRREVIRKSLENRGAFILVENQEQAISLIDEIAPEHLELSLDGNEAEKLCSKINNAGAIFLGRASAETFGDYCAGSNHVLPTYGSARFSSPLSVYDFLKRTSVIHLNEESINSLADVASELAKSEGLLAHSEAALMRKVKSD